MSRMFRIFPRNAGRVGRQPARHAARTSLTIQVLGWLPPLRYIEQ